MGITIDEFNGLANEIRSSRYCIGGIGNCIVQDGSDGENQSKSNSKSIFSILSEIYDLIDCVTEGNAHFHYGCSCESDVMTVANINELWEVLYDLADKKCMKK